MKTMICRIAAAALIFFALLGRTGLQSYAAAGWDNMGYEGDHIPVIYDIKSGLPFNEIQDIVQTADGFIYIGGYGGLARYDGHKFYKFPEISSVVSLYADPDGGLWIGTNDKGIVYMAENSEFTFYGQKEGYDTGSIREIMPDNNGELYFATTTGLWYRTTAGEIIRFDDDRLNGNYIYMISTDLKGTMLCATVDGNLFALRGHEVVYYQTNEELGENVRCIFPDMDREGYVYLGTERSAIFHGPLGEPLSAYEEIETPGLTRINYIYPAEGRLWICSDTGIGFFQNGEYHPLKISDMGSVVCFQEDYEGNLWFVSSRNGVMEICKSIFMDISLLAGLDKRVVNSTWMKDGLLYVGTDTGLVVLDSEGNRQTSEIASLLESSRIRAIKEDSRGNLWFCTFSENGLVLLRPDGSIRIYSDSDGLISNYARTILEMSDGTMAVSVSGGIQMIRDEEIVKTYTQDDGIPNSVTLSLCEGKGGRLYLGTNGNGIYILEDDRIFPYDGESDMESGIILRMKPDQKRNCVWIITSNDVCIMQDGRIRALQNLPTGQNTGGCYDLLLSENGKIWVLGGTGIYEMEADELLTGEPVDYIYYSPSGELPHITTSNSRNYVSPEGDAYISGIDGITRFNIEEASADHGYMKIALPYVDAVLADDSHYTTAVGETVTIPASTKRISIHGYVLSYMLSDPEVSYYLEGFDTSETITSKRELSAVSYTNLPGGTYIFHLSVKNPETGEKYTGSLTIVKEKSFYERPLFWVIVAVVFLVVFWAFVKRLLRMQERRLKKKQEEERISAELSMAADIQTGALPQDFPAFPERKDFDIYASMTPAKEVGGDFYDFFLIDEDHLGIVIADVSDKGVPAALFMMSARILISNMAKMVKSPKEVLENANMALNQNNSEKMFVTVWLGILDLRDGTLTAANAGHEYPILTNPEGVFEILKDKHGFVLGAMPKMKYREYTIHLMPGSKVFVYTDGVPEAANAQREFFGLERTLDALNRVKDQTPEALLRSVHEAVNEFVGNAPQFDDLTMLCVEYVGREEKTESE